MNDSSLGARPAVFFGTSSGGQAFDTDALGGNPFATALIELAADKQTTLGNLGPRLRERVKASTRGVQVPEAGRLPGRPTWRFVLPPFGKPQARLALVLVVGRYDGVRLPALHGALNDERRIASMLAAHGFSVVQGLATTRQGMLSALRHFARASAKADAAVLYATAHGFDVAGTTYLLPSDFPAEQGIGAASLRRHAVPVPRLAAALRARSVNLLFFAGCRRPVPPDA